ncbi:hypothetical protein C1646_673975 [Rhizophagus diaphanus]|nr:hypothetical protein C1646_673975 [Rhizophagus diaphanus] [Rhizophagus sp. MUCL 43196]
MKRSLFLLASYFFALTLVVSLSHTSFPPFLSFPFHLYTLLTGLWQYSFLQYLIVPYPSIRSWATNGLISPDQRDKYYYTDPAKTNTELPNSILCGTSWPTVIRFTLQNDNMDTNEKCFWIDIGRSLQILIIVGTFGILELNSSNNYDSPFNVWDPFQNPNLSKEQVQRLFEEFGSEHKLKVESKVTEDIYLQTNGYITKSNFK